MKFTTRIRVRYAETDQMGVVYHANYLAWFEVGRVEMMRSLGFSYQQLEQEGHMLPVVEVSCRYRLPARFDDELLLETELTAMRGPILKFSYQLWRCAEEDDDAAAETPAHALLCDAMTTHVVVDTDLKKSKLPEHYTRALLECIA